MYAVSLTAEEAPDIWHALADPTRRQLIDRLTAGPLTTSALCEGAPMSRFGVMKHLGVLERSGLVTARRQGRLRLNYLNAAPLLALQRRWVSATAARLGTVAQALSDFTEGVNMDPAIETVAITRVAMDWETRAPVQRLWTAIFSDIDRWWPTSYRALPGSSMSFAAEVGGGVVETGADGSRLLWYTLTSQQPMKCLDLVGHLAARYGGPATSHLHLELCPSQNEGATTIKMTDCVIGPAKAHAASTLKEGWQAIFGEGLVAHLEATL
jgi:DNA-binding transcriptional ArsR family regulator